MRIIDDDSPEAEGTSLGRPAKYPWNQWLQDGKRVRIYHGDDFDVEVGSLRPQIHLTAKRRGGTAQTRVGREDGVVFIDIVFTFHARPLTQREVDKDLDGLRKTQ